MPHLLACHLPALRTIPVLQRDCESNKPHMNLLFSISTLHSHVSTSCHLAFVANFFLEGDGEGHLREGNRTIAQQMQGCSVGPSAAAPRSASNTCSVMLCPKWSIIMNCRENKRLMLGMNIFKVKGCDMPHVSLSIQCVARGKIFA